MKRAISIVAALALVLPAHAHRLDEYLQALRLDITPDKVELELDLTPGVDVAPAVCALVDADGDGKIGEVEAQTYARRVIADLVLELDGDRRELTSLEMTAPECAALKEGVGVLRLRAAATFGSLAAGSHELHVHNDHRPAASVYLVNALQPVSSAVRIERQERDELQTDSRITFTVAARSRGWSAAVPTLLVLVAAALVGWFRRK